MRPPKPDPRRPHHQSLTAQRITIFVLDTPEEPRTKPCAHNHDIGRLRNCSAIEQTRAALDDLVDVLHGSARNLAASREKTREKIVAVDRGIDGERLEVYSVRRV